jgi:hypothetical protein
MHKLLNAELPRLWRDKVFWIGIIYMVATAFSKTIGLMSGVKSGYEATLSNVFFRYAEYILVIEAVFCSIYIGTEYSDGTMRNKMIMGHRRHSIYFSYLIVSVVAGIVMCCSYIAVSMIGISLGFSVSIFDTLVGVLCSFFLVCSISAIYTMITMLSKNRTATVVICVVLSFALLVPAYDIRDEVNMARQAGQTNVWNEFLYAFLPGCQALQLSLEPEMAYVTNPVLRILCSFVLFLITTAFGQFQFNKTDLK